MSMDCNACSEKERQHEAINLNEMLPLSCLDGELSLGNCRFENSMDTFALKLSYKDDTGSISLTVLKQYKTQNTLKLIAFRLDNESSVSGLNGRASNQ